jgi:phosphatidylglycerophosphate synthase
LSIVVPPATGTHRVAGVMKLDAALVWLATVARVPLAACLLLAVATESRGVYAWVAAIVVADVLDGVVARQLGRDSRRRRIVDATLDRLTVHAAFVTALVTRPALVWLYVVLASRDVIALSASAWLLSRRRLLLLGGSWHKLASLSCAGFGVALVSGDRALSLATGIGALSINYVLLLDYAGGFALWRADSRAVASFRITGLAGVRFAVRGVIQLVRRPATRRASKHRVGSTSA